MLEATLRLLFVSKDLSAVKDYCTRQWGKILSNRVSVQVCDRGCSFVGRGRTFGGVGNRHSKGNAVNTCQALCCFPMLTCSLNALC